MDWKLKDITKERDYHGARAFTVNNGRFSVIDVVHYIKWKFFNDYIKSLPKRKVALI